MIRGLWSPETVAWIIVAAAVPVVVLFAVTEGLPGLARLVTGLGVVAAWQFLFRLNLGVPASPATALAALAVVVVAPAEVPVWQIAIAVSFGVVIGELIFGGWGRNFLSGGVVALAFLSLSVPNAVFQPAGLGLALAVLPGAVLLLVTGILPLAIVVAYAAALLAVASALPLTGDLAIGTIAFITTFLAADPVASATTVAGRLIQGALAGALTAVLMTGTSAAEAAVFAALLAALFAPLIDQGAIALHLRRRRTRHGRA